MFQPVALQETTLSPFGVKGPPLRPVLFPAGAARDRHRRYAEHVAQCIKDIDAGYPTLNFHDRIAIIVPDGDFRRELHPLLEYCTPLVAPNVLTTTAPLPVCVGAILRHSSVARSRSSAK